MSRWIERREQGKIGQTRKKELAGVFGSFYNDWIKEFGFFLKLLSGYINKRLNEYFGRFENVKGILVGGMYRQRGKYAGIFIHAGMVALVFLGLTIGPTILAGADTEQKVWLRKTFGAGVQDVGALAFGESEDIGAKGAVLGATAEGESLSTEESDKPRSEVIDYEVQQGDTLSTIASKFGVSMDTIKWANEGIVKTANSIKPGQSLKIPPVTGVVHVVGSGETIYSIAKKYNSDAQSIVDFPFNTFTNDETFSLAVGQVLYVPDGVKPQEVQLSPSTSSFARVLTPDAGVVSGTGTWIWPAAGIITQPFRPWHSGVDIANHSGGPILAADSGKVIVAGWPDNTGYGNRIVIDHGNGFRTLYGHLSKFNVVAGQTVKRGDVIGQMGSTGRSTGTHLHFEIRWDNHVRDPLQYLK